MTYIYTIPECLAIIVTIIGTFIIGMVILAEINMAYPNLIKKIKDRITKFGK